MKTKKLELLVIGKLAIITDRITHMLTTEQVTEVEFEITELKTIKQVLDALTNEFKAF